MRRNITLEDAERATKVRLAFLDALESERYEDLPPRAFAELALGFYSTEIADLGEGRWQIAKRGKLQTIRFDRAIDRKVDFARSRGVLGQQHFQGSLYVALDPAAPARADAIDVVDVPALTRASFAPGKVHADAGVATVAYVKAALDLVRAGKALVSLGVMELLARNVERIGIFRPIIGNADRRDSLVELLIAQYNLDITAAEVCPYTYADIAEHIQSGQEERVVAGIVEAYAALRSR